MDIIPSTVKITPLDVLSKTENQAVFAKSNLSNTKIKEVARHFEGMFLSQMFGHMFKGIKSDGLMGGGNGEAIFQGLLIQEYGTTAAKAGGIGLAKSIERQLIAMQEVK